MLHILFKDKIVDKKSIDRWSNKDNQYLIDNYKDKNVIELSKELGRSEVAVKMRLSVLRKKGVIDGYAKPIRKDQEWLDGLDAKLIELYPENNVKEIADKIGKTESQVYIRVNTLRAKGKLPVKYKTQKWEDYEVDFIIKNYKDMTVDAMAEKLERSMPSVRYKLSVLRKQGVIDYKWF